jgi:hypothetical protein
LQTTRFVLLQVDDATAAIALVSTIIIVGLALYIWMLVWIYRDAKSRGKEAALWVVIAAVAPIVGLIIYILVRNEPERPVAYYPPIAYYPPPGYQYQPHQGVPYQYPHYPQYQQYQPPPYQQYPYPPDQRYQQRPGPPPG